VNILQLTRRSALAIVGAVTAVGPLAHTARAGGSETLPPLVCTFKTGATWSYAEGTYTSAQPQPLVFDIQEVDFEAQTARLVLDGKVSSAALRVVRTLNGAHFIEVANEGYMNLTTVFDVDVSLGQRPAIHSRHLGVNGQPVFAQYAGFCTGK
jgi:hypothetical protein